MAFPLLPIIILGVTALTGVAVGAWFLIPEKLNGKKIAILGARASGKTRFFEYIATQELGDPNNYTQTKARQSVGNHYNVAKTIFQADGKEIEFNLVHSLDVAGGEVAYNEWKKVAKDANYLLYLIDAERLLNPNNSQDYSTTIKKDIETIDDIVRQSTYDKLAIVLTHCDKIEDYYRDYDNFYSKIKKNRIIAETTLKLGGTDKCKLIIGSLKDTKEAEILFKKVLEAL